MGDKLIFAVRYAGESRLVAADSASSFVDFRRCVAKKWQFVDFSQHKFVCDVGPLTDVVVDSEGDFENLIRLCRIVSSEIINVNVQCVGVSPPKADPIQTPNMNVISREMGVVSPHELGMDLSGDQVNVLVNQNQGVFKSPTVVGGKEVNLVEEDCDFRGVGVVGIVIGSEEEGNCIGDVGVVASDCVTVPGGFGIGSEEERISIGDDEVVSTDCVIGEGIGTGIEEEGIVIGDDEVGAEYCVNVDEVVPLPLVNVKSSRRSKKRKVGRRGDIDVSPPSYEICPITKRKPLLSDGWVDLMNACLLGLDGQWLGGAVEFRADLIKYASQMGFRFKYVRNDSRYVHVVCQESVCAGCDWFIKAKRHIALPRFVVHKANFVHKCVGKICKNNGARMSPLLIGELVLENVKNKPETSGSNIRKLMQLDYGIELPYWKAWRTADNARARIFGSFEDSYDQLNWYCKAVARTNPGSYVSLETTPGSNRFERLFIALNACLLGFRCCRPMLFINGTFMKGRARGTLLVATAKDGDNGLFPVAFAVVSAENTTNWDWFLCKLRDVVKHDQQISFTSDRNSGLVAAFPKVFARPLNYYCLYHLMDNLKLCFAKRSSNIHRAKMCELFKECAYAPTKSIFDEKMKIFITEGGKRAEDWISKIEVDKWALCHSPQRTRYGELTSNAVESFNAWISKEREMPITYMIDSIRLGITRWHVERRKASNAWDGVIVPTKQAVWNNLSNIGKTWFVLESSSGDYEVRSTPSTTVNLTDRSCTCMQWQITGFPCAHAVSVIRRVSDNVSCFVDPYFLTSKFRESYGFDLHPIPETEKFHNLSDVGAIAKINPPVLKRPPGRPRKERITAYGVAKKSKPSVCGRCGRLTKHDTWTCHLEKDLSICG